MPELDRQRARIQEDLRGIVSGQVRCDPLFCQLYATDGSIFEVVPIGVVCPSSVSDVVACVQYARETGIPIVARGAGSGTAGGALGGGLILDFSRNMRRLIELGDHAVRVQAGITLERLNSQLRQRRRWLPINRASESIGTIGGAIATDASGRYASRYGSVRRYVRKMQVVLADGQVIEVSGGLRPVSQIGSPSTGTGRFIWSDVRTLLASYQAAIVEEQSIPLISYGGYRVRNAINCASTVDEPVIDPVSLLVGSEGTLGLVTEVELGFAELPVYAGATLILFEGFEQAAEAAVRILEADPVACELIDNRQLVLAREDDARLAALIPAGAQAAVLVEYLGKSPEEIEDLSARLDALLKKLGFNRRFLRHFTELIDSGVRELESIRRLARPVQPAFYRSPGARLPVVFLEDAAAPADKLPRLLTRLFQVLQGFEVTAALYCSMSTGKVHLAPLIDLTDKEEVRRLPLLAEKVYELILDARGSITTSGGWGLSRTPFLGYQYPKLREVFRQLKGVFDPTGLLNPGKIVGNETIDWQSLRHFAPGFGGKDEVSLVGKHTPQPGGRPIAAFPNAESWNDLPALQDQLRRCNGCGECRTQSLRLRMCPLFRVLPTEEASPRAKANLLRGLLGGRLPPSVLAEDALRSVADLCFQCHVCTVECPVEVDIPRVVMRLKGAHAAAKGLLLSDWVMARLDRLLALAIRMPRVANWILKNRLMRWLLEKTLGIAQGRKIPPLANSDFLRWASRKRLTRPIRRTAPKVAFFVDLFVNYFDPTLGQLFLSILEHNGIAVYVPERQVQSGLPAITCGALDIARQLASRNLQVLGDAVRQGYHVVTTEPAVALCLKREYPQLLDHPDAALVAANTSDACSYLWALHRRGALQLDFSPLSTTVGYQMPCRLKALRVGSPGESLLRLIPGLKVIHLETGCSGIAGTFGLKATNYRTSLRVGFPLISSLRDPQIQAGTTECSACKIQMEQGTSKPTVHPLKLLACAYGMVDATELLAPRAGG